MTYAIIYDTGYATAALSGTQTAKANRAGVNPAGASVYGFGLNIKTESMNGGGSVQNESELRYDDSLPSASPVTFNGPVFVLNCSVPHEAIDHTNYKYGWLYQLTRLERTKGVKILAMKSAAGSGDYAYNTNETLPEMYGRRYLSEASAPFVATATGHTSGTVPHLVGYVENVSNITYSATKHEINFTITFRVIEDLS